MANESEKPKFFQRLIIDVPIYDDDICDYVDKYQDEITQKDIDTYIDECLENMEDSRSWISQLRGYGNARTQILDQQGKVIKQGKGEMDDEKFTY